MPLVTRKITAENESTTYSKDVFDHTFYVPPKDVRKDDVITEPVSDAQLAELAETYPAEYGAKAKAAGVTSGTPAGRLASLLDLPAKELVREIADMDTDTDSEILWALFESETAEGDAEEGLGTGKRRVTVLEALEAHGVKE